MKGIQTNLILLLLLAATTSLVAQTNALPSSGSVGVGTTSPLSLFHVQKTANQTVAMANSAFAFGDFWSLNAGLVGQQLPNSPYAFVLQAQNRTDNLWFPISINPIGGNVGIGTTSPSQALDVNGAIRSLVSGGSNLFLSKPNGSSIAFDNGAGVTTALIEANNGPGLEFWTNTVSGSGIVNRMVIDNAGNVGIGTTTPLAKLDVNASGTALNIYDAASSNIRLSLGTAFSASSYYASLQTYQHNTGTVTGNIILEPSGGNVGIGTTNPTYKLAVNGVIRAKEVIVDTGWSDYVFDENYKLKGLSETEAYIKAEHHLPGIPSAQDVAEHGVSMGEMQSRLLAKIEELTLYVIAQEKHQVAQEQRIQKLEAENTALRSAHP